MSDVEVLYSPKIGRGYSTTTAHGTKANGFVFVTGQVAVKPGEHGVEARGEIGEMGTLEEQTVRVMENVKAILAEAGTTLAHVVKRNDEIHAIFRRHTPSERIPLFDAAYAIWHTGDFN